MVFHLLRKYNRCFFRINTDASITYQDVLTDTQHPAGGLSHIHLPAGPPGGEGLSGPRHNTLLNQGCLDTPWWSSLNITLAPSRITWWMVVGSLRILSTAERAEIRVASGISVSLRERRQSCELFLFFFFFHFPSSKETQSKEDIPKGRDIW